MSFEKILHFLALEGYGVFVWTAFVITLVLMTSYVIYLVRAHSTLQKRVKLQTWQGTSHDT